MQFLTEDRGSVSFAWQHCASKPSCCSAGKNARSIGRLSAPGLPTRPGATEHGKGTEPLPSLTFLGYLYGAVTDFTCSCSSLVSWSVSWDRNCGVRTMKAFTTCSSEPERRLRVSGNQLYGLKSKCLCNEWKNKLTLDPLEKDRTRFKSKHFQFPRFASENYLTLNSFSATWGQCRFVPQWAYVQIPRDNTCKRCRWFNFIITPPQYHHRFYS